MRIESANSRHRTIVAQRNPSAKQGETDRTRQQKGDESSTLHNLRDAFETQFVGWQVRESLSGDNPAGQLDLRLLEKKHPILV